MEVLDRFFPAADLDGEGGFPAFNVWSDGDGAVVTSELPGVVIDQIEITVSGKKLTVKAVRSEEPVDETARRIRRERPAGTFERTLTLGFHIDGASVKARMKDGVLTIALPRAENDKPRTIAVTND